MLDLFICHAAEDKSFVLDLARLLKLNNIDCWVDKFQIKVGDKLTLKINKGLRNCKAGIVVLSHEFLTKGPGLREHELDYLKKIEEEKQGKIFPIWLDVGKDDVQKFSPDLADTMAVIFNGDLNTVVSKIIESFEYYFGKKALIVPLWEDPFERFLLGRGELMARKDQSTGNIFDFVVYLKDDDFPLVLGNRQYSRNDLWDEIAFMFEEYTTIGDLPEYYKLGCEEDTKDIIWKNLGEKYHMIRPEGA